MTLGQEVTVAPSAQPDVTILAWEYLKQHPSLVGTVEWIGPDTDDPQERLIAVSFSGLTVGHSCNGVLKYRQGQYITEKHLCPLVYNDTMPNIGIEPVDNLVYDIFGQVKSVK